LSIELSHFPAPDLFIIAIDSQTVVKWIGGSYFNMDSATYEKVAALHRGLARLVELKVRVHLIWIKAHDGYVLNEFADGLAKWAVENIRRFSAVSGYVCLFGEEEWANCSQRTVTKRIRARAVKRTRDAWDDYVHSRGSSGGVAGAGRRGPLTSLLVQNRVSFQIWFRRERNRMSWKDWSLLCSLRSGHIQELYGQRKFDIPDDSNCPSCSRGVLDSLEHLLFQCSSLTKARVQFVDALTDELSLVRRVCYRTKESLRLHLMLFPFERELLNCREGDLRDVLFGRIMDVICLVLSFVRASDRFD
jgi:hypothetical protein